MRVIVVVCALWCACGGTPEERPKPDASAPADAGETEDAAPQDAAGDAEAEDAASALDAAADAETEPKDAAPPPACEIEAPTVCPDPMPRYDDVSPIFAARCTSCHNGSDGMWPLSSYQHVADWYGEIRAQMLACTMPPVDSGLSMPLEERLKILDWIRCGFPR